MNTTDSTTVLSAPAPEAGSWQETLAKSAEAHDKSGKYRKRASVLLWQGAQSAIEDWTPNKSSDDVSGEALYAEVLALLGTGRKGDASKIKTVALAVKNNSLILSMYPNLSKAYTEAVRLTKTVAAQAAEDKAAEKAVEDIAANAPKTSSTPEGAAIILLAQGLDEAARLLLDALGKDNAAAHRSLLRAISQEIAGRVPQPVAKAPSNKPKGAATKAKTGAAKKAAAVKTAGVKAKPGASTSTAAKVEAPKVQTKAKPVVVTTKAEAPAKADVLTKPVLAKPVALAGKRA